MPSVKSGSRRSVAINCNVKIFVKYLLLQILCNFEAEYRLCIGEDGTELSAAGQMETVLGVKGLEQV